MLVDAATMHRAERIVSGLVAIAAESSAANSANAATAFGALANSGIQGKAAARTSQLLIRR